MAYGINAYGVYGIYIIYVRTCMQLSFFSQYVKASDEIIIFDLYHILCVLSIFSPSGRSKND